MSGRLQFWLQGYPNRDRPWTVVRIGNWISTGRYHWWRITSHEARAQRVVTDDMAERASRTFEPSTWDDPMLPQAYRDDALEQARAALVAAHALGRIHTSEEA